MGREVKENKVFNTRNFLWAVLGTGLVVEALALTKKEWGGSISANISKGLKASGPIGLVAFGYLIGHWADDAGE